MREEGSYELPTCVRPIEFQIIKVDAPSDNAKQKPGGGTVGDKQSECANTARDVWPGYEKRVQRPGMGNIDREGRVH